MQLMDGRSDVRAGVRSLATPDNLHGMKKDRIRELAEERIAMGYSRQHIQDELVMMHPEAKPKRIADVLRYLAPDATRVHFRSYQQGLLAVRGPGRCVGIGACGIERSSLGATSRRGAGSVSFPSRHSSLAMPCTNGVVKACNGWPS